jgi:hypothetical protein
MHQAQQTSTLRRVEKQWMKENVVTKQSFNDEICLNPAMYHWHSVAKEGHRQVATPRLIIYHEVLIQTMMEDSATR